MTTQNRWPDGLHSSNRFCDPYCTPCRRTRCHLLSPSSGNETRAHSPAVVAGRRECRRKCNAPEAQCTTGAIVVSGEAKASVSTTKSTKGTKLASFVGISARTELAGMTYDTRTAHDSCLLCEDTRKDSNALGNHTISRLLRGLRALRGESHLSPPTNYNRASLENIR
jgi:hypothetical protein